LLKKFLILRRTERNIIINIYIGLCVKYPLFLSDFNGTLNFLGIFSENPEISNFLKIRPYRDELFHADGQTDRQTRRSWSSLFTNLWRLLKDDRTLKVIYCAGHAAGCLIVSGKWSILYVL